MYTAYQMRATSAVSGEPSPGVRQTRMMIAEPVSVPTSGISEKKKATTASTAGKGAWMIVRKIALRMPLMTPRLTCPMT